MFIIIFFMKKVDSFSSTSGRMLIQEVYYELKYKKQLSSTAILMLCWRICVSETDLTKYLNHEVRVLHRLGFIRGTKLWMEEIVNRFYFATINSFVYFGAAVLLVLIGLRRFSERVDDSIVIAGVVFEAMLLFFMFIVMLFSPDEDSPAFNFKLNEDDEEDNLITEIGEIARDFAHSSVQLENLTDELRVMNSNQENLVEKITALTEAFQNNASPNPDLISIMKSTNIELKEFKENLNKFNRSAEHLKKQEIEFAVRREIEKIVSDNLIKKGNES